MRYDFNWRREGWEDGIRELSHIYKSKNIISILKKHPRNEYYMMFFRIVYNMARIKNTPNSSSRLYDYFIVNKSKEVIYFINSYINDHLDKHNIDIQNSFKVCVKWNMYRKIAKWISKYFSYLDRFYTRPEKIQKVLDRLYNNFMERYNVSGSDIEHYEEEWKQLYKAQQRLQLSKIISYNIPYDLYDTISQFASEKNITRKLLFKSIKIEIGDDESKRSKINLLFKLL